MGFGDVLGFGDIFVQDVIKIWLIKAFGIILVIYPREVCYILL